MGCCNLAHGDTIIPSIQAGSFPFHFPAHYVFKLSMATSNDDIVDRRIKDRLTVFNLRKDTILEQLVERSTQG